MDRKFVRFLIVFSSILIICGFAFLYGFRILEEPDVSDYVSGFSIGTISLIGQLFFFIAYDLIGDESWWRKVIKVFFLILAWIIIIASFVLALFIFLADLEYNLFPWEGAVIAQWISCGLLSYAIYRSIEREENAEQIAVFLEKHQDFTLISQRQLLPDLEIDGAFAAVMKRNEK